MRCCLERPLSTLTSPATNPRFAEQSPQKLLSLTEKQSLWFCEGCECAGLSDSAEKWFVLFKLIIDM